MEESHEKWIDFRTEDSWQGTLDSCKTGNTHKNQPEVYFCVLDGETNPLRAWGRLSLAFPMEQLEAGHLETEEGLTGSSGSWAIGSVTPMSQHFQIFYDMALLSVGPWVLTPCRQCSLIGTARTEGPGMTGEAGERSGPLSTLFEAQTLPKAGKSSPLEWHFRDVNA